MLNKYVSIMLLLQIIFMPRFNGLGNLKILAAGHEQADSNQLKKPVGLAIDLVGNLYIADSGNHRIIKLTTSGILTTVVGTNKRGFSGDGGPAISAQLSYPYGLAVDSTGNLYIADTFNDRIRKVTPAGMISTIAGDGRRGRCGNGGPAANAQLVMPSGVAVDSKGNVYIVDTDKCRISKVTPDGLITTLIDKQTDSYCGSEELAIQSSPSGITIDSGGNVYVIDNHENCILKISPAEIISTVIRNVKCYSSDNDYRVLYQILKNSLRGGLAVDSEGNLFIVDSWNNIILKYAHDGTTATIAENRKQGYRGDGLQATSASLYNPEGVVMDSEGNLYIADTGNNCIRKVAADGVIATLIRN